VISFSKINILHLPISVVDYRDVESIIENAFSDKKLIKIGFVNAHYANLAFENFSYRKNLLSHDYLLNDGIGLDLAVRMLGSKFKENMVGTDLIPHVLHKYKNHPIFLLGGTDDAIAAAKSNLLRDGVNIVGSHSGYFSEPSSILTEIANSGAEILIIGMGAPYQERFIADYKTYFDNVRIAITGGAIIDFIGGVVPRAPLFFRKLHIEWLYRLSLEPRRLFKRYVIGNPLFLYRAFKFALQSRRSE
jgi:exopolysaccharide biosynthesis WecB/TagA/CpsF family protein